MTPSTQINLMKLNKRLHNLEKLIRPKFLAINERLQREVDNEEIHDFEIELQIDFYTVDGNEPLAQYFHFIPAKKEHGLQIGDGENYNTFYHWIEHEMSGEKLCWLYHALYDHIRLSREEMIQIDRVWWDINVSYQYGNLGFEKIGEME